MPNGLSGRLYKTYSKQGAPETSSVGLGPNHDQYRRKADPNTKVPRLLVVCFAERWDPVDMHAATILHDIQRSGILPFARILILDRHASEDAFRALRIVSTPATVFYYDGKPLEVSRPDWENADYRKGAPSVRRSCPATDLGAVVASPEQDRWVEVIRYAREVGAARGSRLDLDF